MQPPATARVPGLWCSASASSHSAQYGRQEKPDKVSRKGGSGGDGRSSPPPAPEATADASRPCCALHVDMSASHSPLFFRPKRQPKPSSDEGYWDCSVCTFKNSAEAFKCLMCDVRKGTSTR